MPRTQQIQHAKKLARQALDDRVGLVEKLAAAATTEEAARTLLAAAKDTAATVGPGLTDHIIAVRQAAGALLAAATAATTRARKDAIDGGWSLTDLRALGLATTPPPRTRTPATPAAAATPAAEKPSASPDTAPAEAAP